MFKRIVISLLLIAALVVGARFTVKGSAISSTVWQVLVQSGVATGQALDSTIHPVIIQAGSTVNANQLQGFSITAAPTPVNGQELGVAGGYYVPVNTPVPVTGGTCSGGTYVGAVSAGAASPSCVATPSPIATPVPAARATWVPTVTDGTNLATLSIAKGWYYTYQQLVVAQFYVALSSLGSMSGAVSIGNLPFPATAVGLQSSCTISEVVGVTLDVGYTTFGADINNSGSAIRLFENGSVQTVAVLVATTNITATTQLIGLCIYPSS